jgi:hypothetical protein
VPQPEDNSGGWWIWAGNYELKGFIIATTDVRPPMGCDSLELAAADYLAELKRAREQKLYGKVEAYCGFHAGDVRAFFVDGRWDSAPGTG